MSEWKTYKLGEICLKVTDGSHFSPKENLLGEKLIASVKDMNNNGIDFKKCKKITKSDFETLVKNDCQPLEGDVLFSKDGTMGIVYYCKEKLDLVLLSSIAILRPDNKIIDGNYFAYYLKNPQTNQDIQDNYKSGSALPRIVLKDFKKLEVTIPESLETQTQIAQILTSLDDKIELNLQMNQTLEAMAQALFKEWFVDFNFPNFDGELENDLPKGWKKCQVKDICEANASTLNSKDVINEVHYIEISEVDRGIIKNISIYKRGEEPSRAKRKLKHGDTVLSTVRPNRGSYFLSIFPNENLIASTGFAVFSPVTVPFSYLYIFLTNDDQLEFYGKMADGAAYPAINQSVIMNMEVILPAKELLEKYHDVSGNLLIRVFDNLEANKILTQTRDTLLPKLMSGKLELKN